MLGEEKEEDGEAWALGPLARVGGGGWGSLLLARDEDTDWQWQEVSGGREASLVPGRQAGTYHNVLRTRSHDSFRPCLPPLQRAKSLKWNE